MCQKKLIFLLFISFLFFSCDCRTEKKQKENNDIVYLNFDCDNQKDFQPLHLDVSNGFGIMGKLYLDGNTITKIDLKLKEAGCCDRYYIKDAHLVEYGFGDHNIRIEIERGRKTENSFPMNDHFDIAYGDIVDIHIMSEDERIRSSIFDKDGNFLDIPTTVDFGTEFCKSKIVLGDN